MKKALFLFVFVQIRPEFMSYALLHDLHDYDGKKVAAFYLHLKGPALA
jgi:hypothetical protein